MEHDREFEKKMADFKDYFCKYKCKNKDKISVLTEDDVKVNVIDTVVECTCPKCDEEFEETVYGCDVDFDLEFLGNDTNELNCENCPIDDFIYWLGLEK